MVNGSAPAGALGPALTLWRMAFLSDVPAGLRGNIPRSLTYLRRALHNICTLSWPVPKLFNPVRQSPSSASGRRFRGIYAHDTTSALKPSFRTKTDCSFMTSYCVIGHAQPNAARLPQLQVQGQAKRRAKQALAPRPWGNPGNNSSTWLLSACQRTSSSSPDAARQSECRVRNARLVSESPHYRACPHATGSKSRAGVPLARLCWPRANRTWRSREFNSQALSQHRVVGNEVGKCGRLDEIGILSGARRLLFMERPTWSFRADPT